MHPRVTGVWRADNQRWEPLTAEEMQRALELAPTTLSNCLLYVECSRGNAVEPIDHLSIATSISISPYALSNCTFVH